MTKLVECNDHEWEFIDESFDHAFGTEVIEYFRCSICGEEASCEQMKDDFDPDQEEY